MEVAIVAAVQEEVGDFIDKGGFELTERTESTRFYVSSSRPNVGVAVGGIGKASAQEATRRVVEMYRPERLISAGFAGGVRLGMESGQIILCDRLWAVEGPPTDWTPQKAASMSLSQENGDDGVTRLLDAAGIAYSRGGCLTVSRIVFDSPTKARIGAGFPVSIVDMESFWVSQMAEQHHLPSLVVRAVLDPLEQTLPSFVGKAAAKGADGRWRHALRYALERPMEIPTLIRIAGQARAARSSLTDVLTAVT